MCAVGVCVIYLYQDIDIINGHYYLYCQYFLRVHACLLCYAHLLCGQSCVLLINYSKQRYFM